MAVGEPDSRQKEGSNGKAWVDDLASQELSRNFWTSLSYKVDGTNLSVHIEILSTSLMLFLSTVDNPRQTLYTN